MTNIYLTEGPRDGETITTDNLHLCGLGMVWNVPVPPRVTFNPDEYVPMVVHKYRIYAGPDDCGHYAAAYVRTEEY